MLKILVALLVVTVVHSTPLYKNQVNAENDYDLIVYGATPAGFAAAVAAKNASTDNKVLLLEPTGYVGGMASPGGIGLRDSSHDELRSSGSQYQWGMLNAEYYGVSKPVWQPDHWVGQQTFLKMLKEVGVELRLNTNFVEGREGVRTAIGTDKLRRITEIQLESGEWLQCKYVIDASYEGELMAATENVNYTFGRESKYMYNESFAGVTSGSIGQFEFPVNPYVDTSDSATLLKWVQGGPDPRTKLGKGDGNLMAYSFRACLTKNTSNMAPFEKPEGYDPIDFELQRRLLQTEIAHGKTPSLPWGNLNYHGYPSSKDMKYDACCGKSPVGIDAVGLAVGYANATRAQRKVIYDKHRYYVQGLMWFWANDPAVPEDVRETMNTYGLCKDEWPDNGHFPPQMYVREAARMCGGQVFTQNDRISTSIDSDHFCKDSIAVGSWAFDIHEMQRVVVKDKSTGKPMAYNEGLTSPSNGGTVLYDIPYYVLLPNRNEVVNLAVPNCPAVSHVAFSAIREEPTLWQLGTAAGVAIAEAILEGGVKPLQDLDIGKIQAGILAQDSIVRWPKDKVCKNSKVQSLVSSVSQSLV